MQKKKYSGYLPEQTRMMLLQAAAEEIWRSGFRAASLSVILSKTKMTKGALYHHFKNKKELGYAVVDELLRLSIHRTWILPLQETDTPLEALMYLLNERLENTMDETLRYGCPLGNLAYEMSPLDEGFRLRIESVFQEWRESWAAAFQRGIDAGNVSPRMKPARAASFIVSAMEGATCTAKSLQDTKILEDCFAEFADYLGLFKVT